MKIKTKTRVLDLSEWMTQKDYSIKYGTPQVLIGQWIHRAKASETKQSKFIDYLDVPELGLTLVRKKKEK